MTKTTCIILEDQPPAQRLLQRYVGDIEHLELVGTYADPTLVIRVLQQQKVDLLFLDIHLPKISGLDFLRTLSDPPAVILTTAYGEYAVESYELKVVDYLLKPFSFDRFLAAINRLHTEKAPEITEPKELFVKSGHTFYKVLANDIYFIKADNDYTELCTVDRRFVASQPLHHWEETLAGLRFLRTHKSYIVNLAHVAQYAGSRFVLSDGREVPVGRSYKDVVQEIVIGSSF